VSFRLPAAEREMYSDTIRNSTQPFPSQLSRPIGHARLRVALTAMGLVVT